MPKFHGLGFLTIAIGARRYLQQAEILSLSLRHNMPGIPLAIVTDSNEIKAFADVIIAINHSIPIGAAQKLLVDEYSPFEKTLFIDSDCIATRPFHTELGEISQFSFSPVVEHFTPIDGGDEYLDDVRAALVKVEGTAFPKFNGGVYYFDASPEASSVFRLAREYYQDYKSYGIRPFDRGGPNDETVIALALAHLGRLDLYNDAGRLMRTPTGLRGPLLIDPIGGGCTFERTGGVVHPAICHFAGRHLLMPEYRLAEASLRSGVPMKDLDFRIRWQAKFNSVRARALQFVRYRFEGVKKRFRKIS